MAKKENWQWMQRLATSPFFTLIFVPMGGIIFLCHELMTSSSKNSSPSLDLQDR